MKAKKLEIGFRVDASNSVGTGHLMEVLVIIESLKKRINFKPFVITHNDIFTSRKLKGIGLKDIEYISGELSDKEEAVKIVSILKKRGCDRLVVDLRRKAEIFYKYLAKGLKYTFIILDDEEVGRVAGKTVANFSITQDPCFYKKMKNTGTNFLIGPAYFPMNSRLKYIKPVQFNKKVRRIFLNQGGSDPYGLVIKILKALEELHIPQEVRVVIGGAFKARHNRMLGRLKGSFKGRYKFYFDLSQKDLYRVLKGVDFAVSAPGNTLYELAYLGIPTVIVSHHKRHDVVARAFEKRGVAVNAGIGTRLTIAQISKKIIRYLDDHVARRAMSAKAKKMMAGVRRGLLEKALIRGLALARGIAA